MMVVMLVLAMTLTAARADDIGLIVGDSLSDSTRASHQALAESLILARKKSPPPVISHGLAGVDSVGVVFLLRGSYDDGAYARLMMPIQIDTEQTLGQAGIAISYSTRRTWRSLVEALPVVELEVSVDLTTFGVYAYSVGVGFWQTVATGQGEAIRVVSWEEHAAGVAAGKEEVAEAVRTKRARLVNSFVEAWQPENPRGG